MKHLAGRIHSLLALAGLALLAAGCDSLSDSCTGRLWTQWPTEHYVPVAGTEVKMFQRRGSDDVLVQYTEQREKTGATRPRAYYAFANLDRVQQLKKPRFVSLKSERGLVVIPVAKGGGDNLSAPLWAQVTPSADGFRLFRDGVATDWYHLPVYVDECDQAERVLLTPAAFTADVAVAGAVVGVVGLYLYAGAYCPYDGHDDCSGWNCRH